MTPNIDPNVVFKNFLVAIVLLGTITFAALIFRPGSVATVGQGGGTAWDGGGFSDSEHDDD